MRRRDLLKAWAGLVVAGLVGSAPPAAAARAGKGAAALRLGPAHAFDYAALKGQARSLAGSPYRTPAEHAYPALRALDWDAYQSIRFRPERALWADDEAADPSPVRLQFFHLGLFYQNPVRMHELHAGQAREIVYDPAMFDYGKSGLGASPAMDGLGFAGFRVYFPGDWQRDVAAFLGASYFRAVGGEMQYGISARGLAIDSGMERAEEFPAFTAFWFERPASNADRLTVYALLDSPSISGAYRFDIFPGAVLRIDVDCALYPRRAIERLGIAPLTSMFQHGENDSRMANDWRPEIHDSDGLAMWTGAGERIWRPLANPPQNRFSAYADENPRGFGLFQRDRDFDHYQDDGVFYERRPSVWIEPRGNWGRGAVQLVELATKDETFDNIVAFWNPADKPHAGQELLYSYRTWWGSRVPQPPLAQVVATRTGIGGVIGRKRTYYSRRFVVDFAGGRLAQLPASARVEPVISVSHGAVEITSARPLAALAGYRAMFDLRPPDTDSEPITLRLFLRASGEALSETWLYQWTPPTPAERAAFIE